MSPSLLVPIQVDALAIRPGGARPTADCTAPFAPGGPTPFALRTPRPPGIHLHWSLPDALCAPDVAMPDRWLVTRLSRGGGGRRRVDAWVLAPTAAGPWDRTPLEYWVDDRPSVTVDASGSGAQPDPTWTAYADNVAGVLGMHDDLAAATGPVAYAVCGWWSSPSSDPLAGRALHDVLRANRWFHLPASHLGDRPDRTVLHGAALDLGWPDPGVRGGPPVPSDISVTLGATAEETLARLLTAGTTDDRAEPAVTLLLHGLVDDLATPGGPSRADAVAHQSGFEASAGEVGDEWVPAIVPLERPEPTLTATALPGTLGGVGGRPVLPRGWSDPRGGWRRVPRAGARWFRPASPLLALTGGGRGFRHNADGRFEPDGSLRCRTTGETIATLAMDLGLPVAVEDLLEPIAAAAEGLPEDAPALVRELVLLDPGSAEDLADQMGVEAARVLAQQRALWLLRDRRTDREALVRGSGFAGVPPSPVAVTLPVDPWAPMHVDWEVEYRPTPGGPAAWEPGEVDLVPPPGAPGAPTTLRGRALLSGGLGRLAAAAARPSGGGDLATALADLDLLTGSLAGLSDSMAATAGPVRAGTLSLTRLRVVDGFGRHVDLGPGWGVPALGASLRQAGPAGVAALAPRFLADARLIFEYDAGPVRSPVCGFLVPDPLEPALEFAGADGEMLGALRLDAAGTLFWDDRPGLPALAGREPADAIADPDLAAIGTTVLAWAWGDAGRDEGVLAAALRALDASLWTVNRSGSGGEEHRALLTSQPLVVVRARLGLELRDPPAVPPEVTVRVRLGSLTDRADGLVAVIRRDDRSRIGLVDPGVLAGDDDEPPVDHPALRAGAEIAVRPGDPPIELILLVCPHTAVSATSGWLPRKSITMLRDWIAPGLSRLTPTLRLGPVLVDPRDIRLPLAPPDDGTWRFARRAPGGGEWEVTAPRGTGEGGGWGRPVVAEGWLTLDRDEEGGEP